MWAGILLGPLKIADPLFPSKHLLVETPTQCCIHFCWVQRRALESSWNFGGTGVAPGVAHWIKVPFNLTTSFVSELIYHLQDRRLLQQEDSGLHSGNLSEIHNYVQPESHPVHSSSGERWDLGVRQDGPWPNETRWHSSQVQGLTKAFHMSDG